MFPNVFLAIPAYDHIEPGLLKTPCFAVAGGDGIKLHIQTEGSSALTMNFNRLWATALNQHEEKRLTHFAMLHADIVPDGHWISLLMAEMNKHGADIVSAVSPIKDDRGLTTTGLWDRAARRIVKRFTVKEILKLPATFTAADAGYPEYDLLINTGCWLCRFTDEWVWKFPGFDIENSIQRLPNGKYNAFFFSEDWKFSEWAAQQGLKVMATSVVALEHWGKKGFRNDHPWGMEEDPGDAPIQLAPRVYAPESVNGNGTANGHATSKTREIVAVRYAEDMAWVHKWLDEMVIKHGPNLQYRIYNKGPGGDLPNVGHLDWTYLYHIVNRWDSLADWTIFTQADPFPHLRDKSFEALLTPREHPMFPFVVDCKEWDETGRLAWHKFPETWKRRYETGAIRPAKLSIVEWFKQNLDLDINQLGGLKYHPGAIFAVNRENIKQNPKALYERLLEQLGSHLWPEESHYLERGYCYLFGSA